jgi:hypothetical protein
VARKNHFTASNRDLDAMPHFPTHWMQVCHQKIGEEDYVRDALGDLGAELAVHKVAMKPGKPLA